MIKKVTPILASYQLEAVPPRTSVLGNEIHNNTNHQSYPTTTVTVAIGKQIQRWHSRLLGRDHFTCTEITSALGLHMRQLHAPLLSLGWTRTPVWDLNTESTRRRLRIIWTAPGRLYKRPARGRPPIDYQALWELTCAP